MIAMMMMTKMIWKMCIISKSKLYLSMESIDNDTRDQFKSQFLPMIINSLSITTIINKSDDDDHINHDNLHQHIHVYILYSPSSHGKMGKYN